MNRTPDSLFAAIALATGIVVMLLGLRLALNSRGGQRLPAGFDLSGHGAGDHQPLRSPRRLGRLYAGLLLMLFGLGVGGGIAAMNVYRISPAAYYPNGLQLFLLHHGSVADQTVAKRQLIARSIERQLTVSQIHQLATEALQIQADLNQPWTTWWGGWIEQDYQAGRLSAEQWQQYLRGITLQASVHVFDVTRGNGEPTNFSVDVFPQLLRSATAWPREGRYELSNVQLLLDDRPIEAKLDQRTLNQDEIPQPHIETDLAPLWSSLADGTHTLRVRTHLTATLPEQTIQTNVDQTIPFSIGSRGFKLVHAPQADATVRNALHVSAYRTFLQPGKLPQIQLAIQVDGGALPVNIGFTVVGLSDNGGRLWEFGPLHSDAKGPAMTWISPHPLPLPPTTRSSIDVQLTPTVFDDKHLAHIVWDGALIYRDVPIQSEPPTQPAD